MFERVLDFLASFWNVLRPLVVVDDYEGGVILRFGRYKRDLTPGLHWKPIKHNVGCRAEQL
jgi:regulator of protease activity HflC (stomatin/prohibitin superfamily)